MIVEALQAVIKYLENREKELGERHPSLPSLRAYLLDEQESAGLEGKTKQELIQLIKGRRKLEQPGIIRVGNRVITPDDPTTEATQITDVSLNKESDK